MQGKETLVSIELTGEQRQTLLQGKPVRLPDPETGGEFVVLRAEVYEQLKQLLEDAEDRALHQAWLDLATKTRRAWVQENPYGS
jgi:hypothetical protein